MGLRGDMPDVDETATATEGEAVSSKKLRQIAEAIRVAFPRPTNERELVLIDVDPRQIHAFWSLPVGAVAVARAEPEGAGEDAPMILRLTEIGGEGAPNTFFDVEVVGLQAQSYVHVESDCRRYRGELGLRRPDGVLISMVASNDVELPPAAPAAPVEAESREPVTAMLPSDIAAVSVPFFTAPEPAGQSRVVPGPPVASPGLPTGEAQDHRQESPPPAATGVAADDSHRAAHQPPLLPTLPLENVLAVSSFAPGSDEVDFEVNAELRVFGRARPGSHLVLFGRPVPLRPDGTFSVVRPLPRGALLLSSLLIGGDEAAD